MKKDITTDSIVIKRIIQECSELYTYKFNNQGEMD